MQLRACYKLGIFFLDIYTATVLRGEALAVIGLVLRTSPEIKTPSHFGLGVKTEHSSTSRYGRKNHAGIYPTSPQTTTPYNVYVASAWLSTHDVHTSCRISPEDLPTTTALMAADYDLERNSTIERFSQYVDILVTFRVRGLPKQSPSNKAIKRGWGNCSNFLASSELKETQEGYEEGRETLKSMFKYEKPGEKSKYEE